MKIEDLIWVDSESMARYPIEAKLLNRSVKLLSVINKSENRIRNLRCNVATWTPLTIGDIEKEKEKLRRTKAARERLLKSYQETIEKLHRIAYTFESCK